MERIYLDHNATTPVEPAVREAIIQGLQEGVGNPSSVHYFGQLAKGHIVRAKQAIASLLDVRPREIVFTSGGTEGLNLLIRGIIGPECRGHIITSDLEHSAVMQTVVDLEQRGCSVDYLHPGSWGAPSPEMVAEAIRPDTRLIALMAANNETGVLTDVEGVAAVARQAGIPLVIDGVCLLGKELFTIPEGVTGMAFSGHKFHAPQGIGFVFIRRNQKLYHFMAGGSQQGGFRAGTENVPGIIGLGVATTLLKDKLPEATAYMAGLRDHLLEGLRSGCGDVLVNGAGPKICNTLNVAFPGVNGESLLMNLDLAGVAVSHGSACAAGALEPSRVLRAMDLPLERAASSIRLSLSRMTTREEVERAIAIATDVVKQLRSRGMAVRKS